LIEGPRDILFGLDYESLSIFYVNQQPVSRLNLVIKIVVPSCSICLGIGHAGSTGMQSFVGSLANFDLVQVFAS
jgi:hypothetical protein